MAGVETLTPSRLIWQHLGEPDVPAAIEPIAGYCATCAQPISEGMPIEQIVTHEFYGGSDFLKFGTHVCRPCAWLYKSHRTQPHSFFATESELFWPTVNTFSSDRPTWQTVLTRFATDSSVMLAAALLTTDTKPRVWPYARVSAREQFRIYVHAPDFGMARLVPLDLPLLPELYGEIEQAIALGYSKRSIRGGLYADRKAFAKDPEAWQREHVLASSGKTRDTFTVALITAPKDGGE